MRVFVVADYGGIILPIKSWRCDALAFPERAVLKEKIEAARRSHRPVKNLERAMKDIVTARLKLEMEMRNGQH